jgi:cyclophilin family peptidyl-prolyl cis-trans isomerase/HEAT repeat protein
MLRNAIILMAMCCIYLAACVPGTTSTPQISAVDINDVEIQKIIDLQDKQDIQGLYKYFRHQNPTYRRQAILAMASIKDESTIDSLVVFLKDPIIEVRTVAAFALGQIGSEKATVRLIAGFNGKDSISVNNAFNAAILEAVGKTGNVKDLIAIASVQTYRATDTLLIRGQAKAIYNMALRNIVSPEGTSRMVDLIYLSNTPEDIKLIAANYIGRANGIDIKSHVNRISQVFSKETKPYITMALATGMGKSKDTLFLPNLRTKLATEKDYRVKCNILRSLENFNYFSVRDDLFKFASDPNPHVSNIASATLVKNGSAVDVPKYALYDTATTHWQTRANMCAAVLAHTGLYFTKLKTDFSERVKRNIREAKEPYIKSAYVQALAKDPYNYYNLSQLYNSESSPLVKSAIIEAQGSILKHPLFYKAFGKEYIQAKSAIFSNMITAIKSGDVGQMINASSVLKDPSLSFKEWVKDSTLFKTALGKLKLPRDIEAYNEIKACSDYFAGIEHKPVKIAYNHAIEWTLVKSLSNNASAAIKTTQGVIRISLLKDQAPASVANFVALITSKFFNEKTFHRVVPNFVVQTGCPRGDGFGSLDYTIRSELTPMSYNDEGYVGMASAGNHTECSQWFITHSPTLHLDGNYTIFGKVIEGMDVVHKLLPGDKIIEVILTK